MTEKERFENWFNSLDWYAEGIPRGVFYGTALQAWKAARRWIPVEEMFPTPGAEVWCYSNGDVFVGFMDLHEQWYHSMGTTEEVTHWQPLPEPPE